MQRGTKEFHDIQQHFEKTAAKMPVYFTLDFSKPEKGEGAKSDFYNNGQVNDLFNAYLSGYAFARALYQ